MDLYIDVSVIDPTGQRWRNRLMLGGAGEAAMLKEAEKQEYYKNHFKLADKRHEFAPFILESQGGVGKTALRVIKTALQKKKEMNLRNLSRCVKKEEVTRGAFLKKIIFESQRQMARTLVDKTAREDHTLSKIAESHMIIQQATWKAVKALKAEDLKLRPATLMNPV